MLQEVFGNEDEPLSSDVKHKTCKNLGSKSLMAQNMKEQQQSPRT